MTISHDERKLPIWARKRIKDLEFKIERLQSLKNIHAILSDVDRDWFPISGPTLEGDDYITLWILNPNKPHPVCSLGHGDMLFVGRALAGI